MPDGASEAAGPRRFAPRTSVYGAKGVLSGVGSLNLATTEGAAKERLDILTNVTEIIYLCGYIYTYPNRYGIFILKIISKYKPVYSQSTNPCKAILLEYIPTF